MHYDSELARDRDCGSLEADLLPELEAPGPERTVMPLPGMASYALSKSALQGMARGLARDFGPRGITINIVQPGPIDTDANPEDGPMRELMHSFMAIKRHGRPEEVAGMVAWLAGPEAGFVTGAMHTIDGAFGA